MNQLQGLSEADAKFAEKLMTNRIRFKDNAVFHAEEAEKTIFEPVELPPEPSDVPFMLEDIKEFTETVTFLTREQEKSLFLRLNYCKFRAQEIKKNLSGQSISDISAMISWYKQALAIRAYIAKMNMRITTKLVYDFVGNSLDVSELTSEANLFLIQAIDGFDTELNTKFSTYAYHAIMRGFWKKMKEKTKINNFAPVSLDADDDNGNKPNVEVVDRSSGMNIEYLDTIQKIMYDNSLGLTDLELNVIKERYLNTDKKQSVAKVATLLSISSGVVNEIEKRVLPRIRKCLENV